MASKELPIEGYAIEDPDEWYHASDLMDGLILDMGDTVKGFTDLFSGDSLRVQYENAVVTIDEQDICCDAKERLDAIVEAARSLIALEPGLSPGDAISPLLRADGWTVTNKTLRTPLWLHDVQEWPLSIVECWHEELGCLEQYTFL